MEGEEIAVWVHTNLDRVELTVNGESVGTKDVKKDAHLEWNVKYVAGEVEARGYKDGKLAMTVKRETIGPAAKLVMKADRSAVNADGEDVAMFAVEVRDSQDRIVPITNHLVSFSVTGSGQLIGVGNGDPTDQGSDKGHRVRPSRVFAWRLCSRARRREVSRFEQAPPDSRMPA